jgi:hypothetical protein
VTSSVSLQSPIWRREAILNTTGTTVTTEEQKSRGAEEQRSRGAEEQRSRRLTSNTTTTHIVMAMA